MVDEARSITDSVVAVVTSGQPTKYQQNDTRITGWSLSWFSEPVLELAFASATALELRESASVGFDEGRAEHLCLEERKTLVYCINTGVCVCVCVCICIEVEIVTLVVGSTL